MKMFVQTKVAMLNAMIERLRTKIPGLPSNRVLFSAAGLFFAAVFMFIALQKFLAPKQPVTTYTLPYTQTFDDVDLKHWFSNAGVWTLRTGTLQQTVGGEEAGQLHIPLKVPQDAPYHASVFVTLKKDTRNAGLSFNAQYPDLTSKQHRVYISRINPTTLELVAGYMDQTGAFISQAQVPLNVNTTEFRLDIYVYGSSYMVQVNGQRMIENRPLFYKNGMLGFYALGPAVFDTFSLTVAQDQNPGNMVYTSDFDQQPGGAGWVPISGTWQIASKSMSQSDATAVDAAIGYETSTFENFTLRATFNHLSGQGAGMLFNMPSPYEINGAEVVRYSDETDSVIWGYYDAKGVFNRDGFMNVSPAGTDAHTLRIYSGTDSYDIYLDDQLIARQVPLQSAQGAIGMLTSRSAAAFSYVEVFPLFGSSSTPVAAITTAMPIQQPAAASTAAPVQPTQTAVPTKQSVQDTATPVVINNNPKVSPTTAGVDNVQASPTTSSINNVVSAGAAPYHGVFNGKLSDAGWKIINGDWKFSNGSVVQARTDGFDFAAVYIKTAFKSFSIQTSFTHIQGSGAGLLFNMQYTDQLAGASMVRYSDKRDNAIVWGYFDATGVYKNQGYADVPHAGTERHTLRVVAGDKSYSIYLDNRMIVQAVPYGSGQNSGYFGLVTSRAHVIYDEVTVDGVGAVFKGTYSTLDGFTDQRVVSGKWNIGNNKAVQSVTAESDYIWNTGVQASDYTIAANVTLPNTTTSGGGFIIHMSERGTKNNSYVVRLKDGGTAVWWGSINDAGSFKGQGSAKINKTSNTFVLKLVVKLDKITIFVNDQEIVTDVQITPQDGWIGLLSYGGPVTFENVKLDVNQ